MPNEAVAKLIKPMGHYYEFIFEREKFKTSSVSIFFFNKTHFSLI